MRIFGVTQNVGIAFRVGSSFKEGLTPTCVFLVWPKMQVLHLGYDLRINMLKPHMRIFCVPQNAGIAFRVGFSFKEV
jgi:hypothetical protein